MLFLFFMKSYDTMSSTSLISTVESSDEEFKRDNPIPPESNVATTIKAIDVGKQ